ncbi:hypothetical protein ACL02U_31445 [Streptomyces sp. MS06]|uniref:hypothetical protein n=1 Tax=Streptomyces sp. MS06 TaxID=3385974 RepID=UPI0039A081E9
MEKDNGNPLPTRNSHTVEDEVSSLSSRVLDMLKVKGKVTEPGAYTTHCSDDDPSKGFWVRHPWSLYGLDNAELGEGFANLKRSLPDNGWKITMEGNDGSRNKNPEVKAVHEKTHTQLDVSWLKGLDGNTPLLDVTVYSQCFKKSD